MIIAERNKKLKYFITCLKCEISGKHCDDNCPIQFDAGNMEEIIENLEEISKILEQEPCEDVISRKAVLNTLDSTDKFLNEDRTVESYKALLKECYETLPSVTPTRKKGIWIRKLIENDKGGCVGAERICTCCGKDNECDKKLNYCPNCGADMRGNADDKR